MQTYIYYKSDKLMWANIMIILFIFGSLYFCFKCSLSTNRALLLFDIDEGLTAMILIVDIAIKIIHCHKDRQSNQPLSFMR